MIAHLHDREKSLEPFGWKGRDAVFLTPGRKAAGGVEVGTAGVGVVDLSGEKLQHAPGGLGSGREKGRGLKLGCRRNDQVGSNGHQKSSGEGKSS